MKTLYKRTSAGKIQEWTIEINGNSYRTISGQTDGKKVTTKWTKCQGKNKGKSNGTTDEEQALLQAESLWKRKLESGYFTDMSNVDSGDDFSAMLAGKWEKFEGPCFSQPKLDGVRCHVSSSRIFSRGGKDFVSVPHIFNELKELAAKHGVIFDGELYNHEYKNDFNKIISLVKKTKPSPADIKESEQKIQFHIYDVYMPGVSFADRIQWLKENVDFQKDHLVLVNTDRIEDEESLNSLYAQYIEQGYEGQMVRVPSSEYQTKRSKFLMKRKEFQDDEFRIVDVVEGSGNRSGMAGRVILKKGDGTQFAAGIKGGESFYKSLLGDRESLIGEMATIRYQELTPDGIPRFPVMICVRNYE